MFDLTMNPWMVSESDFPAKGTPSEQLYFLLNYAVLAPSEYNIQPWRFKVHGRTVEVYADRARRLPIVDPDDRELTISCGAAFLNLRVALRQFGCGDQVEIYANREGPDLLARLSLSGRRKATLEEHALFHAILQRRTNRHSFEARSVPNALLSSFEQMAGRDSAWFYPIQGEKARQALVTLITTGDRQQWTDKHFRRELAGWVRPKDAQEPDGLPAYASRRGSFAGSTSPVVVRTFDLGNGEAARDRQLAEGSPLLAVLGTFADTWSDWFSVGQAVERMLLRARAEGVWASFLNQPIEVPSLRAALQGMVGGRGFPQLVLRMGYGPEVPPTPRRSVSEVLLSQGDGE